MTSPYASLPGRAFWRPAVADRHYSLLSELTTDPFFREGDRIATAGSCFAQHIGRRLRERGSGYLDYEQAPDSFTPQEAHRHGFGLFSCRYGNVYTVRQLLQLVSEAFGEWTPAEVVWTKNGRYYDALRPSVDPVGHRTPEDVLLLRRQHLGCVRRMIEEMTVFVFTLGLTEAWESIGDGTIYPTAPGTIVGSFSEKTYRFRNFRYQQILEDFEDLWAFIKSINPATRLILTVSPVPLTATASGDHVLVASTQSKATLRAIAGDLAAWNDEISYFPSYELIASHPMRGTFFNPDLRNVSDAGVDFVMSHLFRESTTPTNDRTPSSSPSTPRTNADLDLICDEEALEQFVSTRS